MHTVGYVWWMDTDIIDSNFINNAQVVNLMS